MSETHEKRPTSRQSQTGGRSAALLLVAAALLTVVFVAGLVAAACSDDETTPTPVSSPSAIDPRATLETAAEKMSADGLTAHVAFGSQLSFDGPTETKTYVATGSGDLRMPTTMRYLVDVSMDDGGASLEVITLDGETYYTRDAGDEDAKWRVSPSPLAVAFDLGGEIERYMTMATDVEVVKSSREDGQWEHVVRLTMDPLAYAKGRGDLDMEQAFMDTFSLTEAQTRRAIVNGTAVAEFTIGQDDSYVHNLSERWLVRLPDGQGYLQETVMSFSKFGKPIEPPIEAPEVE
jgi:hypothetical protein